MTRKLRRFVEPEPMIPWGTLIGALLAVGVGYVAIRNYPQAVRYLRMRAM